MKMLIYLLIAVVAIGGTLGILIYRESKTNPVHQGPDLQTVVIKRDIKIKTTTPTPVDYRASFLVVINGQTRSFDFPTYHFLSPDSYIDSNSPNIIQVKKSGITYDDFFKTLPMKLDHQCITTGTKETFCNGEKGTLSFYLNGVNTPDALISEIKNGDRLLITYGNESEGEVKKQVQALPDPLL